MKTTLPAVSIRRYGSEREDSFSADMVEDMVAGQHGVVRLRGGPALCGKVREARAVPLGCQVHQVPPGKTPEQLRRRSELGQNLLRLAAEFPENPNDGIEPEA